MMTLLWVLGLDRTWNRMRNTQECYCSVGHYANQKKIPEFLGQVCKTMAKGNTCSLRACKE